MEKNSQASAGQIAQIVRMLVSGEISAELAQALIEGKVEIVGRKPAVLDRITVPNLSAADLVAQTKKEFNLNCLDADLAKWDFITDERGKTYEVQIWTPGRGVVPATEVRTHFKDGFVGNTAAFIAWVKKTNPQGSHASIPEDDQLFRRGDYLCALYFRRVGEGRELNLCSDVRLRWHDYWSFVAFREVKT